MKKIFIFLFFMTIQPFFSQIQGEDEVFLSGDLIEPKYEGGLEGFQTIFYQKIKNKKVMKGETIVASFEIDKLGLMTKIKIIRFKDDETAMSVVQTLKEMNNLEIKWQPATRLGKVIPVKLEFPFKF